MQRVWFGAVMQVIVFSLSNPEITLFKKNRGPGMRRPSSAKAPLTVEEIRLVKGAVIEQ